jgi:excisionase family DNA binding protein
MWHTLAPPERYVNPLLGTNMTEHECLTVGIEEAARILGYSRNTAYAAAKRGELPTIRLGRKLRVPRAALIRMLDAPRESGSTAQA